MDNQMTVSGFLNFCIENAKRHFLKFLGLYAVALIVLVVGTAIGSALSYLLDEIGAFLGGLIILFLSISVSFGFLKNILNLCRGEKVDFMVFIKIKPLTMLYFFILVILTSIIISIGYILLIIPGVILTLMLLPASFLVIDRDMGPISAIKESFRITSGHKMDIFVGLCISITVAFYLSVPIISLVFTIPMMLLIYVYPYLLLTGQLDEAKKNLEKA